jgi:predicted nucleotidyltransferase
MVQKQADMDSEIVLELSREKAHVRELARRLGESHTTVMRRANWLLKENVIGYKTDGRNKVFFLKDNLGARSHAYAAEKHKLLKLLSRYPRLGVILEGLLKKVPNGTVVLFGSYAKFCAKEGSDIDIYIDTQDPSAKRRAEEAYSGIRAKIGRFDPDSLLIREIVKNHVILRGTEEFYEKAKLFSQAAR